MSTKINSNKKDIETTKKTTNFNLPNYSWIGVLDFL